MAEQPPQKKPLPRDFEEMDFTVEQESWNEYELKDGSTIRGRIILQKIMRDPYNPQEFGFKFSPALWAVYAPVTSRGEPNIPLNQRVSGGKFEVQVLRNHEPWNVYRIVKTGQKLKIKLTVTEISRFVNKFDADGMPVYDVPSGVSVAMLKDSTTSQ